MEEPNQKEVIHPRSGDVVVSRRFLRPVNNIVQVVDLAGTRELEPSLLAEYLRFLELVVTNERILALDSPVSAQTDEVIDQHPDHFTYVWPASGLDIRRSAIAHLQEEGVLIAATAGAPTTSPEAQADLGRQFSRELRASVDEIIQREVQKGQRPEIAEAIANAHLVANYGRPAFIAECAKDWNVPFLASRVEGEWLRHVETVDRKTAQAVRGALKARLDAGAQSLLDHIAELSPITVFPSTPIASEILLNAATADDLVNAALELRSRYTPFRNLCTELETEMLSETTTIKRRRRISQEIRMLGESIWGTSTASTQRIASESSALLGLASTVEAGATIGSTSGLASRLLSFPVEHLVASIRRRKVRLFIEARNSFLRTRAHATEIARRLSLPEPAVRRALSSWRRS